MTNALRSHLLFIAMFANAAGCKPDFDALKKGDGGGGGSDVNGGGRGGTSSGAGTSATSGGACDGDCAGSGTLPSAGAGGSTGLAGSAGTISAGTAGMGGTFGGSGGSSGASTVAGAPPTCEITPYVLSATPALIYNFDTGSGNVAVDSSGNSLNGSFVGTPVWNTTGRIGGALNLSAANQYVELPADVLKDMSAVTIATWVKLSANPASSTLFDFGSNSTNHFYLRTNAGAGTTAFISFGAVVNGGTPQELITTYSLPTGVWKHVALTVGDGVAALYVDGLKIASRTVSFAPSALGSTAGNWIGHTHTSAANLYGSVDDFRIYARALEPKEVQALAPPGTDYLHFDFDEPCGNKAYDRSDLKLEGTLPLGGTWTSGYVGGALSLNGTNQYLQLPANVFQLLRPSATQPCSDLTVAMWVQRLAPKLWERLFSFGQGTKSALTFAAVNTSGAMQFSAKLNGGELRGSADEQLLSSTSGPQSGLWGHVAVVLQGGTGRLYFNGQEVSSSPITIKPSDMGATVINAIGQSLYPGENHLNANIDDLRISCRAFAPGEIKILAIAGQ